jgi:hypothetical protein
MTNRELLEWAAKAAGFHFNPTMSANGSLWGCWNTAIQQDIYEWNPLKDDGDAFRLYVKLRLKVWVTPSYAEVDLGHTLINELTSGSEQKHGDPYLYVRRAIVRAAAEIGKSL